MPVIGFLIAAVVLVSSSAAAQQSESNFESSVLSAIENTCIPLLQRKLIFQDHADQEAHAKAQGLTSGISREQAGLFGPLHSRAVSNSFLFSDASAGKSFLMAVGGDEEGCRLFIEKAGQPSSNVLVDRLGSAAGWSEAPVPPNASPRRGFLRGPSERPDAVAIVLTGDQLPGVAYHIVVVAR